MATQEIPFRPLSELLPKTEAGDREFQHLVLQLLQAEEARSRSQQQRQAPRMIDSSFWLADQTLYLVQYQSRQYPKYANRFVVQEPIEQMRMHTKGWERVSQFVVVTPNTNSSLDEGFLQFIDIVYETLSSKCTKTVWDAGDLKEKIVAIPSLGLRYYPELLPNGRERRQTIEANRRRYAQEFAKLHGKINFVGMSVYKEEASSSVDMEKIYIPLCVVPEGAVETDPRQYGQIPCYS